MKGQSIMEVVVLVIGIVTAILLMAGYIKRASNGRIYDMAKSLSEGMYSPDGVYSYNRVIKRNVELRYNYIDIINNTTGDVDDVEVNMEFLANDEYSEESYNFEVDI